MTATNYIGKAKSRVDGFLKVTGGAKYAADFEIDNIAFGYIANSTIASGKIIRIATSKAKAVAGVLEVFTHINIPDYVKYDADYTDPLSPPGKPFRPLFNDEILYNGQPIALVVAETFEAARYAAGLIEVEYEENDYTVEIRKNLDKATSEHIQSEPPEDRGNAETAFADAPVKIDVEYQQPRVYHNPMEPHATIAIWDEEAGSFTLYDKIQGVRSSQTYVSGVFGVERDQVKVIAPFIGGGFGSGLRPQYQLFMAALAAKALMRPVKVVMTRKQMFSFGHRPANIQKLKLGSDKEGKLMAIQHHSYGETSKFEFFSEDVVNWSGLMYECANVKMSYELVPVDVYTPMDTRGPGGTTGMFALETAMDELAHQLDMDPLQLRLLNYAERDQLEDKPFSSKELRACYQKAAEKFGWDKWNKRPGSMENDKQWIGYGVATGVWEALQQRASAKVSIDDKGKVVVSSGTADIGTGTYTVMTQIAADSLGVPMDMVEFKLGESDMPKAPIEGGSWTVSSVGSAVKLVCEDMIKQLFALLHKYHAETFGNLMLENIEIANGKFKHPNGEEVAFTDLLKIAQKTSLDITSKSIPAEEREKYSCYAHSCVMVEVRVDKDTRMITVPRMVTAVAGGKIINPKTAESQVLGGNVWGIGMALREEDMIDPQFGRIMNANLAEYHLAVQADVQDLSVFFVEEEDEIVNPLGAKGLGEIGIVGVAAAIGNAIFNATGKRLRQLPFTLDKLL